MFQFFKKFSKGKKKSLNPEELRLDFKERYHHFRLLLNANNQALEIMAELEEVLRGEQPFGMAYVREKCTRLSADVFQIIRELNFLSSEKYAALFDRFSEIRKEISSAIESPHIPVIGPFILPLSDVTVDSAGLVGAKMANLGEIKNKLNLPVPEGFVVTTAAYERFMEFNNLQPEIDRRIQSATAGKLDELHSLSSVLQQLIINASIPPDVTEAITKQYEALAQKNQGLRLALRSSALGEDLHRTTFAGQYRSILNVSPENLLGAYREVIAGKFGLPAMTYRLNRGIRDEDVAMCVGCMSMLDARAGGVLYSCDPLDAKSDSIIISSTWGLPKGVVDGSAEVDHFIVSREQPPRILGRKIPYKPHQYVCYPDEGVRRTETAEKAARPSLSDEQVVELAKLALRLEEYYRGPQDIEWCLDKTGSIFILQCRPLKCNERQGQDEDLTPGSVAAEVLAEHCEIASPGTAFGPVFIVQKDSDILQFPRGAVLVVEQALPRWATLLQQAAAVVTEYGSLTGHLANVAREFHVPALFSVKGATLLLQNGNIVTVDAHEGKIYKGRIFELLKRKTKANIMKGSPIYETLQKANQHISPLNLLDPDAISFKPENCRTLHDITRFSHEKAVAEMLRFGKENHFPERSGKRLVVDVPTQWWVLNLDDGFKEEVAGQNVNLANVVSAPMLALWEGISTVPWSGPPPVDARGLVSVMFEATQNPALIPGMRSKYADRHYFMISKDYCCLSSRLGFHFSTVETLVGDRFGENYITFHFMGGAADYERRRKRVFFVKEILEGYHFHVDVNGDNLIARMEGYNKDLMLRNLKIVGYLAIHTRQLDMIMGNQTMVTYYRNKICKDIQKFFVREKILYLILGDDEKKKETSDEGDS